MFTIFAIFWVLHIHANALIGDRSPALLALHECVLDFGQRFGDGFEGGVVLLFVHLNTFNFFLQHNQLLQTAIALLLFHFHVLPDGF